MPTKVVTPHVKRKHTTNTASHPPSTIDEPGSPNKSKVDGNHAEVDDDDDDDDDKEDPDVPGEDTIISDDEASDDQDYDDSNTTRYFFDLQRMRQVNDEVYTYSTLILDLRTMFTKFEEGEVVPPQRFLEEVDQAYKSSIKLLEETRQAAPKPSSRKRKTKSNSEEDFIEDDVAGEAVFDVSAFFSVAGNSAIILPRSMLSEQRHTAKRAQQQTKLKSASTSTPNVEHHPTQHGNESSEHDNDMPPTTATTTTTTSLSSTRPGNVIVLDASSQSSPEASQSQDVDFQHSLHSQPVKDDDTTTTTTTLPVPPPRKKQRKTLGNPPADMDNSVPVLLGSGPNPTLVDTQTTTADDVNDPSAVDALINKTFITEEEVEPYITQLTTIGAQIIEQNIDKINFPANLDTLSPIQLTSLQRYRPDLLQGREVKECKPTDSKSLCQISLFKQLNNAFSVVASYYTSSLSHRLKSGFVANLHQHLWVLGANALQSRFRQKPGASGSSKKDSKPST